MNNSQVAIKYLQQGLLRMSRVIVDLQRNLVDMACTLDYRNQGDVDPVGAKMCHLTLEKLILDEQRQCQQPSVLLTN